MGSYTKTAQMRDAHQARFPASKRAKFYRPLGWLVRKVRKLLLGLLGPVAFGSVLVGPEILLIGFPDQTDPSALVGIKEKGASPKSILGPKAGFLPKNFVGSSLKNFVGKQRIAPAAGPSRLTHHTNHEP
jgi:hypothetical protein